MKNEPLKKIVGFLQNAWSPLYVGGTWPRASWLRALIVSRSGERLIPFGHKLFKHFAIHYYNTTPLVGKNPSSVLPPDVNHVLAVLADENPDVVVAFGKQAAEVCAPLLAGKLPLLCVPHPAYRVLTSALYEAAADRLIAGFEGQLMLKQGRGVIEESLQKFSKEAK